MVSQPPGSPREDLPDDDAQYAAFVDEMPSADCLPYTQCCATQCTAPSTRPTPLSCASPEARNQA